MLYLTSILGILIIGCTGTLVSLNKGQCFHIWKEKLNNKDNEVTEFSHSLCRETPLHRAVIHRSNSIEKLISEGIDIFVKDCNGKTPMHVAIDTENIKALKIYASHGYDINKSFNDGNTFLHYAVNRVKKLSLQTLLDMRSEVDLVNDFDITPLTLAVEKNNIDMMRLLLSRGADIRKKTKEGQSYLHVAVISNSTNALRELLFDGKLPVDTENEEGETPILWAVRTDNTIAMKILSESGAKLQGWGEPWGLAQEAAQCGSISALDWLLRRGMNSPDGNGWTPLHWAARYGRFGAVRLLLETGSCVTCTTTNGHTPLWSALLGKHPLVVALLLSHGARLSSEELRFAQIKHKPQSNK